MGWVMSERKCDAYGCRLNAVRPVHIHIAKYIDGRKVLRFVGRWYCTQHAEAAERAEAKR